MAGLKTGKAGDSKGGGASRSPRRRPSKGPEERSSADSAATGSGSGRKHKGVTAGETSCMLGGKSIGASDMARASSPLAIRGE